MRILAVADIHGRPDRLDRVAGHVAAYRPDVLVAAGDLTQYRGARRVVRYLNRLPVPVLAVRGNSDRPHVDRLFEGSGNVFAPHGTRVRIRGTAFVGVSGTVLLPLRSRVRLRERALMARLAPLLDRRTVLVAHPPPLGTLDTVFGRFHAGSSGLRDLVLKCRPAVVLFGHIHESGGCTRVGDTVAVNCTMGNGGGGAVIDLAENGAVRVTLI